MAPTGSVSAAGVNASNIVEGSRKRGRVDQVLDAKASPASPLPASSALHAGGEIHDPEEVTKIGYKLLNVLYHARDVAEEQDSTALLVEPFLALPDAEVYPDYYQIIKRPLTFEDIRLKLDHRRYSSFEEIKHDCETICNNAKRYNQRETPFWLKAKALHSVIKDAHAELTFAPHGTPSTKLDLPPTAQLLFDVHVEGVKPMTSAPPSPAKVKQQESEQGDAKGVAMDEDTSMEDAGSSSGNKTATAGHRRITIKKKGASQASPPAALAQAPLLPAAAASLAAPGSVAAAPSPATDLGHSTDLSTAPSPISSPPNQSSMDDDLSTTHPQQQAVPSSSRHHLNDTTGSSPSAKNDGAEKRRRPFGRGKNLKSQMKQWVNELVELKRSDGETYASDFFEELPSREEYPDYYKVIIQPISLKEINQKVSARSFKTPHSFFSAVRTMIANAKYYNEENSVIWQDADLMEKLVDDRILPAAFELGFTLDPNDNRSSVMPVHAVEVHETSQRGSPSESMTPPAGQSSSGNRLKVKLGGKGSLPGQDYLPDGVGQQQPSTIGAFASPPHLPNVSVPSPVPVPHHLPPPVSTMSTSIRPTTTEVSTPPATTASGRPVRSAASRMPATRDLPPPLTSQNSYPGPARSPSAPQGLPHPAQQPSSLPFKTGSVPQTAQQPPQRPLPHSKGSYGLPRQAYQPAPIPMRYPPSQHMNHPIGGPGGQIPYAVQSQSRQNIIDAGGGNQIRRLSGAPPPSVFGSSSGRPIRTERMRGLGAGSPAASSSLPSPPAIPSFVILAQGLKKVIYLASTSAHPTTTIDDDVSAESRQVVVPVGEMREEVKVLFKLRAPSRPAAEVATGDINGEVHESVATKAQAMEVDGEETGVGARVNGDGDDHQHGVNGNSAPSGDQSNPLLSHDPAYDPIVSTILNGRKVGIHWSQKNTASVSVQLQRGANLLEVFLVPGTSPFSSTRTVNGRQNGGAEEQMQIPCEGYRLWIVR